MDKATSKTRYFVQIPDPETLARKRVSWITVETFFRRKDAVNYCVSSFDVDKKHAVAFIGRGEVVEVKGSYQPVQPPA